MTVFEKVVVVIESVFFLRKNDFKKNQLQYLLTSDQLLWTWPKAFRRIGEYIRFESSKKKIELGLSPQNLGLKPIDAVATRILVKFHWLYNLLVKTGFVKVIAKSNFKQVMNGTPYFLTLADNKNNLIESGRALQRAWIMLCSQGYSLQPYSTFVLPHYCYHHGAGEKFPKKYQQLFEKNKNNVREIFDIPRNLTPIFIFRVGKVSQPFPENMKISRMNLESLRIA